MAPHTSLTATLASTPATLQSLIGALPHELVHANEGADSWTPAETVAHMLHCEQADWMPRLHLILQHGESQPFQPLDRTAFRDTAQRPLSELLSTFATLRAQNLAALQSLHLQPADLERRGTHPIFGTVTLGQLLATWATHDLTHLHQIVRTLAHQNRSTVGPWQAYLGVLHCNGHSQ